jgi:hypothetical protein
VGFVVPGAVGHASLVGVDVPAVSRTLLDGLVEAMVVEMGWFSNVQRC